MADNGKLDALGVLAELRAIVAEVGEDHVYLDDNGHPAIGSACAYFLDAKTPGCIVGYVLARHGITRAALSSNDEYEYDDNATTTVWNLTEHARIRDENYLPWDYEDYDAVRVLEAAQGEQDAGHDWGTALREATVVATSLR